MQHYNCHIATGLNSLMARTPIQIMKQKPPVHLPAGTGKKSTGYIIIFI
jgi:hypothetical protein